jgi:hypothetical protein
MFDPVIRRRRASSIAALVLCIAGISAPAAGSQAEVILPGSGVSSSGVPVSCEAHLMIVGDTLTIVFYNTSTVHSQNPSDLCSSLYFDIYNGANVRPNLVYQSATGDVWHTNASSPDTLDTANANLKAVSPGDHTWQFKTMDPTQAPSLGFGLGTVRNNNLSPNDFNNSVVGTFDYSLYAGDVDTSGLNGKSLVKDHITFVFSGLTGFTNDDISHNFAIGLGRDADVVLTPEPATFSLLLGLGLVGLRRRRRRFR